MLKHYYSLEGMNAQNAPQVTIVCYAVNKLGKIRSTQMSNTCHLTTCVKKLKWPTE
jgi:hypothetical protein